MNVRKSIDGRRILINLKLDGNVFTIVKIYAPNDVSTRWIFQKTKVLYIMHRMNENIILSGDFNCKMHNIADKSVRYLAIGF